MAPDTTAAVRAAGSLATLLAIETVTFVGSEMLFPRPTTLVLMATVAIWFLVGQAWSAPRRRLRLARVLDEAFPYESPIVHRHWLLPWTFAAILTAVVAWSLWEPAERRLWMTGNHGEPPWNRYANIVLRHTDGEYRLTIQFGVRVLAIHGVSLYAYSDRPLFAEESSWRHWYARPDDIAQSIPTLETVGIGSIEGDPGGVFGKSFEFPTGTVTPHDTIVIEFHAAAPFHFVDAGFESRDDRKLATCDAGLACLLDAPGTLSPRATQMRRVFDAAPRAMPRSGSAP